MNNDTYTCFTELKKNETEGSFNITCEIENRSNVYAIIAPHGGKLETGTTEISLAISREDLSLYIFNANKPNHNRTLHITSANFDEPQCEKMLVNVETVLAIHGARDPKVEPKERVWVGGNLRETFEIHLNETLKTLGLLIEINSNFLGKEPNNICNRGISQQGMQLELTKSLRDRLKMDKELLEQFSDAVRTAMMLTYPTA
ncbi:poly-gamma-glutamate hydrolase family protein [Serratia symbiotica]|uniref:poly-gamma-glutamate hydrolase family protein n=1 Tax=Serratia symbiotica TaxID=138074 RepID=UPI00135F9024|nr:poly-gamma-glutamate hydrolase family protein [Serratia symbiotica]MBQ0955607.1 poly-gamma-glutamate hydrolase family protein [Serratia symbiotica]